MLTPLLLVSALLNSHGALLSAVYVQRVVAPTATTATPPSPGMSICPGETLTRHPSNDVSTMGSATMFVPPERTMPLASQYIDRSTMIGWSLVDSMVAQKPSLASWGTWSRAFTVRRPSGGTLKAVTTSVPLSRL